MHICRTNILKYNDVIIDGHFIGKINGTISDKPLGVNGFGYDPIFIPNGLNKTFAEIKSDKKNAISHRMIALQKMESFLFN